MNTAKIAGILVAGSSVLSVAHAVAELNFDRQGESIPVQTEVSRQFGSPQSADSVSSSVPDGPLAGAWQRSASPLRGRIYHSAVWTYDGMIVWGGGSEDIFYNDGGIYDPRENRWRALSKEDAPSGRWGHAAVWTGKEMIIWGGRSSFAPGQHKTTEPVIIPRRIRGDR
jgi:hypothetical protein